MNENPSIRTGDQASLSSVLHPILFTILPVISALSENLDSIAPVSSVRAGLASLAICAALSLVAARWIRHRGRRALVVSVWVLMFFSYGHIFSYSVGAPSSRSSAISHIPAIQLGFWGLLIAATTIALLRLTWRPQFSSIFLAMAAAALVRPTILIVSYEFGLVNDDPHPFASECQIRGSPNHSTEHLPDIYYIIVDGYGRQDILSDHFRYDSREFLDFLASRDFYVAERSRSNYIQTRLSLASSLNMRYLDPGDLQLDLEITLARSIRQSAVRTRLEALGYQTIAFNSGYRTTEISDADVYLSPRAMTGSMVGLEPALLSSSMIGWLGETSPLVAHPFHALDRQGHRERVEYIFDQLSGTVPMMAGPKFVFAHIVSPHPPFVFAADGSVPDPDLRYSPDEGEGFPGTLADYIQGYTNQLTYINRRLIGVIDAILTESPSPPIIVLQADHGPGSRLIWSSPDESELNERTGILNALLLPAGDGGLLRPDISPVNNFRAIMSTQFGVDCPELVDMSYFSNWSDPTNFILIPEQTDSSES